MGERPSEAILYIHRPHHPKSTWIIPKRDPQFPAESRTRTGLRPPPPQSGVSTISPHPLLVWDCKDTLILFNCKFFLKTNHKQISKTKQNNETKQNGEKQSEEKQSEEKQNRYNMGRQSMVFSDMEHRRSWILDIAPEAYGTPGGHFTP